MNFHDLYAGITQPIETCLVGSGGFGRSYLAQARRMQLVRARIAVDMTVEAAAKALLASGIDKRAIATCETAAEARSAWAAGHHIAAGRLDTVIDLPFQLLVEATGSPEAATRHSLMAIEAGRHVALVSKEADSVVGPGLARLAQHNGVVVTPVDGDQPSLLIALVTWAEVLGLEIIAAGNRANTTSSSTPARGTSPATALTKALPALREHWLPGSRSTVAMAAERARILGEAFPLRAVPDLCEMMIVANATGLRPDAPGFHAPPARIPEIAALFAETAKSGLMGGTRRVDVFHHLRLAEEVSFAGGVFIVVRCEDDETWDMLAGKGHVVSRQASTAMLYLPRHLLGVEAATSILDAAGLGRSGYGSHYRPDHDLVAVAQRDLAAGTVLTMGGHHHSIEGVGAEIHPATALADDRPAPFYLVADRRLTRAVKAGEAIALGHVAIDQASALLAMRRRQDGLFADAPDFDRVGRACRKRRQPRQRRQPRSDGEDMSEAAADYPRITRRTLHEEVLERLRDMIIEGSLAPGQRINEGVIGAQLGVSRTPLREAIKTLASEGLVEILPAKGAIVRKFSAKDLYQVLEVLKSLEQLGGRMACEQASDATIEAIHALHTRMLALYETRERLEYFKLNQAIHSAIVAASENTVLMELHETLQARIKRLRFIGNEGPVKWAGAVAEHEEMMAALLKRDAAALSEVIGRHMNATLVRVSEVL